MNVNEIAIRPGEDGYDAARTTIAGTALPAIVLRPRTAQEVAESIRLALDEGLPLAVRSGGHNVLNFGNVDDGAVIDLSGLDAVEVGDGDRVFGDHRQSVGAIVSALRGSLRAVTSIGGAAARLQVTDEAWMQGGDDQGPGAVCLFTVTATRLL